MTKEADLVKLESVVVSLMGRFKTLKQEKEELENQLEAKQDKIDELNEQINLLTDEKTDVHGRVSSLLGSIEEWEQTLQENNQETSENAPLVVGDIDDNVGNNASKLFQVGE